MSHTEQNRLEPREPVAVQRRSRHHGSRGAKRRGASKQRREKGSGLPVGMLVTAAAGSLFVCYLTNTGHVQTAIDGFFNSGVRSAHTHDAVVESWFMVLLPYVAMVLCVLVLYVLLASAGVGRRKRKAAPVTESLTVHEFAELAGVAGVGARVSREMYRMLLPDHAATMRSAMQRPFAEMGLGCEAVWRMFEDLTRRSGGVARSPVGVEALATPMEMMQVAERCVEAAALERRAALQKAAATLEETHRTVVPVPVGGPR